MSGTTTAPPGAPLRIDHLSKYFGRRRGRVTALDDVSLQFPAGSFTAVLGASGSGKSTLLQCAAGLERPSSGRVSPCGTDPASLSDRKRTLLRRRRVGFVFQDFSLLAELTVAENIALPLRLDHRRAARAAIADAAARVGLSPGQLRRVPAELSGGQQQRAAIARALLARPEVIVADEPTGALSASLDLPAERANGHDLCVTLIPFIVLTALFALAATTALAVSLRHRRFALLRAVGATRGQVRRAVLAEQALLALGDLLIPASAAAGHTGAPPGYSQVLVSAASPRALAAETRTWE